MAGRLIRLRYPAACAACGVALARGTAAWWDAANKTTRCEECGASGETTVPAPVRRGVAGGSAHTMAQQKRARREAGVRAAHPRLGGLILALSDGPQDIKNWDKGAEGERKLGAGLDGLAVAGVVALHDRLRPGSRANIDHIAIGPSGVWVIDAKRYAGQVSKRDVGGWFSTDIRLFVGRRDRTKLITAMHKQVYAVRAALGDEWPEIDVRPMLCFVDADWKWFAKPFELDGVMVTWPRAARDLLVRPGPIEPAHIGAIAATLDARLSPAL